LKTPILRLRGRDDRNNADSSGKDCRRDISGHFGSPNIQSFLLQPKGCKPIQGNKNRNELCGYF
jgi:hypothetical protein